MHHYSNNLPDRQEQVRSAAKSTILAPFTLGHTLEGVIYGVL
jgi:hypothetical protein